jgi:hypothetical protein
VSGRGVEASTIMEAMLRRYPTDLLAHRLVQFELFWNGRSAWMREIAERAAPAWRDDMVDYGCFQSVRSFSSEEAGDYELADRCGRNAIEIGRILDLLATRVRNPESPLVKAVPDATIDLQNVASLLMRLVLRGVDIGDRWNIMADICADRIHNHANAFSNAHDMMVLAGSGRFQLADELLKNMRDFAAAGDGNLVTAYRAAGIAVCEAVLAHFRGGYARVIELMTPVRHDMHLIGGSHAQRDVFYQILIDAARRVGRADLIPLYFADIERIGFDLVDRRTLYRNALAA